MIETAFQAVSRLRHGAVAGFVLYAGPSRLDRQPIVAIATKIARRSNNRKTGRMTQVFIIRSDVHPLDALRTGADASVCGDCKMRPLNHGACYVDVGRSVQSVWGAFQRGRYALPGRDYDVAILPELFRGRAVRLGAYGDPAAVPIAVWRATLRHAAAFTGYTHQWRHRRFRGLQPFVMASVDTPQERFDAAELGWRTFRVRTPREPVLPREVVCPASHEAGQRMTCSRCLACGGATSTVKADVAIVAHGSRAGNYLTFRRDVDAQQRSA